LSVTVDLARAAALVLGAVFAWAAVAKVKDRGATARSFAGLAIPSPRALAIAVPGVEAAIAIGLVAAPAVVAWPALALVAAFSIVIARAVLAGATVSCACFGGGGERPVSVVELVRNGGLGALAIVASGAGAGDALWPGLPETVIVTVLVALAWVAFAVVDLRRLGGHVFSTPLPGEARR
jgi:hypothetical protein